MGNFNNAAKLNNAVNAALAGSADYFGSHSAHQSFMSDIEGVMRKHLEVDKGMKESTFAASSEPANPTTIVDELKIRMEREAVFVDLLGAAQVTVNGELVVRTVFRADLIAQEIISNAVPKEAVIDAHIMKAFPVLALAVKAMAGNSIDWNGRLFVELAEEYARAVEPEQTVIVQLSARSNSKINYMLADLWEAVPVSGGIWQIKGARLALAGRQHIYHN